MNHVWSKARRCSVIAVIAAIVVLATSRHCPAADDSRQPTSEPVPAGAVSVSVASGRTFVGRIDLQTDGDLLWLRMGDGPIVLRRPIEWDRVVRIHQGSRELSADDARRLAHAEKRSVSKPLLPPPPVPARDWTTAKTWLAAPPSASTSSAAGPTVASLQIDAELGHWTPTVESSGIAVCIHPTSADGTLLPVDGTLAVDLIAQRPLSQGIGSSDGLDRIGRWTQTVRTSDFGPLGADYRFDFQANHPDFDYDLLAHAIVHARLIVPGQGTVEASQAMVRIRPYSSVRDRLQENTGSRFAPIEETNR